jgi:selenide,water dikinase
MTDITGFGLAGHASEVAKASHISIQIDSSKLPLLPGTLDYSRAGFCAGGLTSNEQFFGPPASISAQIAPELRNVLFDPQTSGGLLVFCHPQDADTLVRKLQESQISAVEIGFTAELSDHLLTVS